MENRVILLLSGGIDSTTLLVDLVRAGKEVYALSFDYGQRHGVELALAQENAKRYQVKEHRVIQMDNSLFASASSLTNSELEPEKYNNGELPPGITSAFVPARNLMFVSQAVSYAEANGIREIYLGCNQNDAANFPDCSSQFIEALNTMIALQSSLRVPPLVVAPYLNLKKSEVIRKAIGFGVTLDNTISCYNPMGLEECGVCFSCVSRRRALSEALEL